jgi:hypothetical protein
LNGGVTLALPDSFPSTRLAAHAVAEHVLCPVRYAAVRRVGLAPAPDGVVTPEFALDSGARRVVGLRGSDVVDSIDGEERRTPVTTLRAAGQFLGVAPGAPPLWAATTPLDLDAPLALDVASMSELAAWFGTVADALTGFALDAPQTLWPEHFDLAISLSLGGGEATFGGSPGDDDLSEPYAYVVPPADPVPDGDNAFWNARFGAALPHSSVSSAESLVAFFDEARQRLTAS